MIYFRYSIFRTPQAVIWIVFEERGLLPRKVLSPAMPLTISPRCRLFTSQSSLTLSYHPLTSVL